MRRFFRGILVIGLGATTFHSCLDYEENCRPNDSTVCREGVLYWVDNCGNEGDKAEDCECGCNVDLSGCEQCGVKECESNSDCPVDYWCDRITWKCRPIDCVPNCTGRCCGSDGCDGVCPDNCPVGYFCDPQACVCRPGGGPCDGVDCDGHGTCVEWQGQALCDCDAGYRTSADGLHCELAGYRISLTWTFSDAIGCAGAQVYSIEVTLLQGGTELASADIDCSAGGADIEELQDGSYTIELLATSNSGENTYYGEASVMISGSDQALSITMEPIGFVRMDWDFEGLNCIVAGVGWVNMKINDEYDTTNLYTATPVPNCTDGGHSTEGTAFFHHDTYHLFLEGICASDPGIIGYTYDAYMLVTEKGDNFYGTLSLHQEGAGCP